MCIRDRPAAIPAYPRHGKTGIQPTKAPQTAPKQDGVQRLVDIEQKKAEGKGRGYERWATMHNLKQMAATLNVYQQYGFTSPEQLEAAFDTAYEEMRQTSGELKTLETKLQGKKEINSGSRTILQHVHALHIFGSHCTEFSRNSVNQYQRSCISSTNGICTCLLYTS